MQTCKPRLRGGTSWSRTALRPQHLRPPRLRPASSLWGSLALLRWLFQISTWTAILSFLLCRGNSPLEVSIQYYMVEELTHEWKRSSVKAGLLQAWMLQPPNSYGPVVTLLAVIVCLSIRNARTPNYAPAQAKLIVLFKLEICLYASKSAWDTTETQPVGQRSLKNQIYPLVTEPLQKYISSL